MKRYMLFAWYHYYPSGGMRDFIESYDTLDDAKNRAKDCLINMDDAAIFDLQTNKVVWDT